MVDCHLTLVKLIKDADGEMTWVKYIGSGSCQNASNCLLLSPRPPKVKSSEYDFSGWDTGVFDTWGDTGTNSEFEFLV